MTSRTESNTGPHRTEAKNHTAREGQAGHHPTRAEA